MNPDAWVAARNIDRFEAGRSLDTLYLSTLSADATPVLLDRLPAEVTRCMFGRWDEAQLQDDALAWNLGRSRARTVLEEWQAAGARNYFDGQCDQVITDDYRG
jgi:hypothetical protein